MNSFLIFLLKSTLSLSMLYLAFSVLMRKDTFFKLNRMVMLFYGVVFGAYSIPLFAATVSTHRSGGDGTHFSE